KTRQPLPAHFFAGKAKAAGSNRPSPPLQPSDGSKTNSKPNSAISASSLFDYHPFTFDGHSGPVRSTSELQPFPLIHCGPIGRPIHSPEPSSELCSFPMVHGRSPYRSPKRSGG